MEAMSECCAIETSDRKDVVFSRHSMGMYVFQLNYAVRNCDILLIFDEVLQPNRQRESVAKRRPDREVYISSPSAQGLLVTIIHPEIVLTEDGKKRPHCFFGAKEKIDV